MVEISNLEEEKKAAPFRINTAYMAKDNRVQPLLQKLCDADDNWQEVKERTMQATLRWMSPMMSEYEVIEFINASPDNMSNRYPNFKPLGHKDVFASAMRLGTDIDADSYDFIPPTFQFPHPQEDVRFQAYQKRHPNITYIAKPQRGACGNQIHLFKEMRDLPSAVR